MRVGLCGRWRTLDGAPGCRPQMPMLRLWVSASKPEREEAGISLSLTYEIPARFYKNPSYL